ncbi:hypothetical protein ARMGADRAFT_1016195 [Armillaria gallica]|uniref:Uncharacterized protein n=1 Tax=Armillaria gallica TaxID=47427 RepID=A0A2H3CYR9_ARMGA|nr:hypothetical protein ARMGADRAFT_1016195 [Armillaria gallica]
MNEEQGFELVSFHCCHPYYRIRSGLGRRANGMLGAPSLHTYLTRNSPSFPYVGITGIPVRTPTCRTEEEHTDDIKATWLRH